MYSIDVYFLLTTYRRGWRRIYPVILSPRRASQTIWRVGHRTTCTNRLLWGQSTRGGFGKLGRTLLLFVGHVSRTWLTHKGDHLMAHLRIGPYMPRKWQKWRRCYGLRERGMTPWSSACNNWTHWSSACDNSRPSWSLWDHHMYALMLSNLHLQT